MVIDRASTTNCRARAHPLHFFLLLPARHFFDRFQALPALTKK